jgi:hypothetical protein
VAVDHDDPRPLVGRAHVAQRKRGAHARALARARGCRVAVSRRSRPRR